MIWLAVIVVFMVTGAAWGIFSPELGVIVFFIGLPLIVWAVVRDG